MPRSAPEPIPDPAPSEAPPPLYLTYDEAGIVVDLSHELRDPETDCSPRAYAAKFLRRLIDDDALAGRWVLEKILKKLYTTELRAAGIRQPPPWPSVRRHLNKILQEAGKQMGGPMPFKTYKWVNQGGRRRKLLAYYIPLVEKAAQTPEQDQGVAKVA